jgi:hypothetical protein
MLTSGDGFGHAVNRHPSEAKKLLRAHMGHMGCTLGAWIDGIPNVCCMCVHKFLHNRWGRCAGVR